MVPKPVARLIIINKIDPNLLIGITHPFMHFINKYSALHQFLIDFDCTHLWY